MATRVTCTGCGREWAASLGVCPRCNIPLGAAAALMDSAGHRSRGTKKREAAVDEFERAEWQLQARTNEGEDEEDLGRGVFCDGNLLVMVEGADLPRRCPICNRAEVDEPTELSIRRETKEMSGVSGLVKASMDKLAGWNYTGPVDVSVYFCDRHRGRWRNRLLFGCGVAVPCAIYVAVTIALYDKNKPGGDYTLPIVAAVAALIGLIIGEIARQNPALVWFKPQRFVDRTVWVRGAGKAFLDSLPEYPKR